MTAAVVLTPQGAEVVAPLSAWHAVNRFHHVRATPGTDPLYRLVGLSDAEAAELARKVNTIGAADAANLVRLPFRPRLELRA